MNRDRGPHISLNKNVLGICMRRKDAYDRDALHFAPFVLFPSPFPRSKFSTVGFFPGQNFPQVKISPRSKLSPGQNFRQVDFSPGQFPLFHPPSSKPRALKSSKAVNHAHRAPFASPLDTLYFSISGHHFILPLISIALSYIIPT